MKIKVHRENLSETLTETALLDNALVAIGLVLARMDGGSGAAGDGSWPPPQDAARHVRVRDDALPATPERIAIHCCLTSASALLGMSQTLIGQPAHLTPYDQVRHWKSLVEQTKIAGRAAYRASLALTDPESRYK